VAQELPTGTVTLLFTDVEGSTRLLHELGAARYSEALAAHRRVIREACGRRGGVEVDTQGDAFFFVFRAASNALATAAELTEALSDGSVRVRVGVHTGTPLRGEGYVRSGSSATMTRRPSCSRSARAATPSSSIRSDSTLPTEASSASLSHE
jgi:class 3 adenylate cyclase